MSAHRKRSMRYPFRFNARGVEGRRLITVWAEARYATEPVDITLEASHVLKSMKLHGIGNTQTCSMAVCVFDHKDQFPHPVDGYVDWTYRRAAIVTKVSKKTGFPTQCVIYAHHSKIAHLNDKPSGQKALLQLIEQEGPITVHLHPIKVRLGTMRTSTSISQRHLTDIKQSTSEMPAASIGEQSHSTQPTQQRHLGVGARRRFAVAQLGGAFKA